MTQSSRSFWSCQMSANASNVEDISLAELTAFSGDSPIARLWQQYLLHETKLAGFNIWAAIFGAPWFFYRKMYKKGFISFLLDTGVPVVVVAVVMLVTGVDSGTIIYLTLVFSLIGVRVAFGCWANIALCQKALREIRSVDKLNFDNDMHLQYISAAGGVNFSAFLLAYFAIGLLQIILGGQY